MKKYNYLEAVKADVKSYIIDNNIVISEDNREEIEQELNEVLFCDDSVTGNGSGSYTFNTWNAEENLCHNWDLLSEALCDFGCDATYLERGAEACDVTIRCYLLSQAIAEVLDEMEE
jgi:hypothetical protein